MLLVLKKLFNFKKKILVINIKKRYGDIKSSESDTGERELCCDRLGRPQQTIVQNTFHFKWSAPLKRI